MSLTLGSIRSWTPRSNSKTIVHRIVIGLYSLQYEIAAAYAKPSHIRCCKNQKVSNKMLCASANGVVGSRQLGAH